MPITQTLTGTTVCRFAQKGMLQLFANFTFNGSGEPDAAQGKPFRTSGLDLDRNGSAGAYTLTVPGTGSIDLLYCNLVIEDHTDLLSVQDITVTEASRTIAFTVYDAETVATPTDPTDGAKLYAHIVLIDREDV